MKKFLLLFITFFYHLHAIDEQLLKNISSQKYSESIQMIKKLMDGSEEDQIQASLLGIYVSYKSKNEKDVKIFVNLLDEILYHKYTKDFFNSNFYIGKLTSSPTACRKN